MCRIALYNARATGGKILITPNETAWLFAIA
jgi:hypothetical protein